MGAVALVGSASAQTPASSLPVAKGLPVDLAGAFGQLGTASGQRGARERLDQAAAARAGDLSRVVQGAGQRLAGLEGPAAIEAAKTQVPELFRAPALSPLRLGAGQSVRWRDASSAVITGREEADGALLESTLPLRVRDERGEMAPVDLALERSG